MLLPSYHFFGRDFSPEEENSCLNIYLGFSLSSAFTNKRWSPLCLSWPFLDVSTIRKSIQLSAHKVHQASTNMLAAWQGALQEQLKWMDVNQILGVTLLASSHLKALKDQMWLFLSVHLENSQHNDFHVFCMVLNKSSFPAFLAMLPNNLFWVSASHSPKLGKFILLIVYTVTDLQTPLQQKGKCSQLFWSNCSEATWYSCVRLERITEHSAWFSFRLLRFSIHF